MVWPRTEQPFIYIIRILIYFSKLASRLLFHLNIHRKVRKRAKVGYNIKLQSTWFQKYSLYAKSTREIIHDDSQHMYLKFKFKPVIC